MFSTHEINFMNQFPNEDSNYGENLVMLHEEHQPKKIWMKNPLRPTDGEKLVHPYTLWTLRRSNKIFRLETYTNVWSDQTIFINTINNTIYI